MFYGTKEIPSSAHDEQRFANDSQQTYIMMIVMVSNGYDPELNMKMSIKSLLHCICNGIKWV